jgi:hypothetical protein
MRLAFADRPLLTVCSVTAKMDIDHLGSAYLQLHSRNNSDHCHSDPRETEKCENVEDCSSLNPQDQIRSRRWKSFSDACARFRKGAKMEWLIIGVLAVVVLILISIYRRSLRESRNLVNLVLLILLDQKIHEVQSKGLVGAP